MSDIAKIVLACFAGASVGFLSAMALAPGLWILGVLAGGAVGYISYGLKAFVLAIPGAAVSASRAVWRGVTAKRKKSPAVTSILVFSVLVMAGLSNGLVATSSIEISSDSWVIMVLPLSVFALIFFILVGACILFLEIAALAAYCRSWEDDVLSAALSEENYRIFFGSIFAGLFLLFLRVLRRLFAVIFPSLLRFLFYDLWRFLGKTAFFLLRTVYSDDRLLCSMWSMIGATIGYFWFGQAAGGSMEGLVFATIASGLIGAGFGVLNYRAISIPLGLARARK